MGAIAKGVTLVQMVLVMFDAKKCETPIHAEDSIVIEAPVRAVWEVLVDVANYPEWWPKNLRLKRIEMGQKPIGCELEIRPAGGRPFRCRVEEVKELESIRMRYVGGFIDGSGEWYVLSQGDRTKVTYHLDVVARGLLVRWISRVVSLPRIHSRSMMEVLRCLEGVVLKRSKLAANNVRSGK